MEWYQRTEHLIGIDGMEKLKNASVAVFGIGGVGSYVAEALTRAGIGKLIFIDGDTVQPTNLNRQMIALHSTLGQNKAKAMERRAHDINPDAQILVIDEFFRAENADCVDFKSLNYVADAIDMVTSKLIIAERCRDAGTPLISSCGTGNKLDPAAFMVCDIFSTSADPLARVMRRELRKRGIEKYTVVFSPETPRRVEPGIIGTVPFVPSSAGLVIAGKIICDIAGVN